MKVLWTLLIIKNIKVYINQLQVWILIDTFKQRSHENYDDNSNNKNVNSSFGENRKMDRLIIMDDVSGIADVSKNFSNFLTVSRKFGYNCFMFFTLLFLPVKYGRKLFLKRIFLIFFLLAFLLTRYRK